MCTRPLLRDQHDPCARVHALVLLELHAAPGSCRTWDRNPVHFVPPPGAWGRCIRPVHHGPCACVHALVPLELHAVPGSCRTRDRNPVHSVLPPDAWDRCIRPLLRDPCHGEHCGHGLMSLAYPHWRLFFPDPCAYAQCRPVLRAVPGSYRTLGRNLVHPVRLQGAWCRYIRCGLAAPAHRSPICLDGKRP